MAKPIKRTNTKKEISKSVEVDGKIVTVKTACKKFANPVKNAKDEFVGNCKKCPAKTKTACLAQNLIDNPAPKKSAGKKITSNNDMEKAVNFILANPALSKKDIVARMVEGSKRSEGGWNTMIGAIRLSMKCLDGKGSGKGAYHWAAAGIKKGILDKKKLNSFVAKKEKKEIRLISGSVNHIFRTYNYIAAATKKAAVKKAA